MIGAETFASASHSRTRCVLILYIYNIKRAHSFPGKNPKLHETDSEILAEARNIVQIPRHTAADHGVLLFSSSSDTVNVRCGAH